MSELSMESLQQRVFELLIYDTDHLCKPTNKTKTVMPGCLVRPKRNRTVHLWPHYEVSRRPSGTLQARMIPKIPGQTISQMAILKELALVVSVPFPVASGLTGTGVIYLLLQKQQRFAYAWASDLIVLESGT